MNDGYRHEYKFLISRSAAELLRLRLPRIMARDPHAGPTGTYTIRSLYFDDLQDTAFFDKVSGVDNRVKYRIRYYNYDPTVLRLEKKEKRGHLTRKTGQRITAEEAAALGSRFREDLPERMQGLCEELRLKCASEHLRPKVLVDYDRTAFVCPLGNTRITLDENLRTRPYCTDLLASSKAMQPVLEPDQVILEVKFDDFLPGYLSDALSDIPKASMAISKFALCMNLT